MRNLVRLPILAVLLAGLALSPLLPLRHAEADHFPVWESGSGLTPGLPGNTVRMVAESVDIQIVERDEQIVTQVQATFEMFNRGPDVQMKVGFPGSSTNHQGILQFGQKNVSSFRVWTAERAYEPTWERVIVPSTSRFANGSLYDWLDDWLVWEMEYPSQQSVAVHVSYEQVLMTWPRHAYVQPSYILRTGALWDGAIGEATITMTAPDGGALFGGAELFDGHDAQGAIRTLPELGEMLGPEEADEASIDRVVWRLHDVEPTYDIGATYVPRRIWNRLHDGETAIVTGTAGPEDYLSAAQAAMELLGEGINSGPQYLPLSIAALAARARTWAWKSAELLPERAAAWEVVGGIELWHAWRERRQVVVMRCWPSEGIDAYLRAAELGSATAPAKLEDLAHLTVAWIAPMSLNRNRPGCAAAPDPSRTRLLTSEHALRPIAEAGANLLEVVRSAPESSKVADLPLYFADDLLARIQADLRETNVPADARHRSWYRAATPALVVGPARAEVTVIDTSFDCTHTRTPSADCGSSHRFELRVRDGRWKIFDASPSFFPAPAQVPGR